MRKKLTMIAVLLAMLSLSSCAIIQSMTPQTPEEQLSLAYNSYAVTLETAVDLYETGQISRRSLERVNKYSVYVRRALDEWASAIEDGLDPGAAKKSYEDSMQRMRDAMEED